MPKFKIPLYWTMYGTQEVEADTLEEAKYVAVNDMDLPKDGEYVSDSCEVAEDVLTDQSKPMEYKFKNMRNAIFNTTQHDLIPYNGETVLILHPLLEDEYDREDVGNMYKVRLPNDQMIDAFEDELTECQPN